MTFEEMVELAARAVETAGIAVILLGALVAVGRYLWLLTRLTPTAAYRDLRQTLGRSILLGLEFLVAGDIMDTVVVTPSISSALALAIIVLIRSFLTLTLALELDGRPPWRREQPEHPSQ